MKKVILICFAVLGIVSLKAQQKSCCKPNVSTQNALLASNADFVKAHLEPLPYRLENKKGEMISFHCADGKPAKAYFIKSKTDSKKFLFVFHEWWGLNDYIKKEAEHYSDDLENVNVIALDLYDGEVATTREDAQKLMSKMNQARNESIIAGALNYAGQNAQIATVGWCMGGSWSLQTAIAGGKSVKGCVMYYGFPEEDVNRLAKINCDILGIFGEKDKFINATVVSRFEANLKKAGKKIKIYTYPADHAFANPSNPQFNPEATKDAYGHALTYLKEKLK